MPPDLDTAAASLSLLTPLDALCAAGHLGKEARDELRRLGVQHLAELVQLPLDRMVFLTPRGRHELRQLRVLVMNALLQQRLRVAPEQPFAELRLPVPPAMAEQCRARGLCSVADLIMGLTEGVLLRPPPLVPQHERAQLARALGALGLPVPMTLSARPTELRKAGYQGPQRPEPRDPALWRELLQEQGLDLSLPFEEALPRVVPQSSERWLRQHGVETVAELLDAIQSGALMRLSATRAVALQRRMESMLYDELPRIQRRGGRPSPHDPPDLAGLVDIATRDAAARPQDLKLLSQCLHGLLTQETSFVQRARGLGVSARRLHGNIERAFERLSHLRPVARQLLCRVIDAANGCGGVLHRVDAVELAQDPELPRILFGLWVCGLRYRMLRGEFLCKLDAHTMASRLSRVRIHLQRQRRLQLPIEHLGKVLEQIAGLHLEGQALRMFVEQVLQLPLSGDGVLMHSRVLQGGLTLGDRVEEVLRTAPAPLTSKALIAALPGESQDGLRKLLPRATFALCLRAGGQRVYLHADRIGLNLEQRAELVEQVLALLPEDGTPHAMEPLLAQLRGQAPELVPQALWQRPDRDPLLLALFARDRRLLGDVAGFLCRRVGREPLGLRLLRAVLTDIREGTVGELMEELSRRYGYNVKYGSLHLVLRTGVRRGLIRRIGTRFCLGPCWS